MKDDLTNEILNRVVAKAAKAPSVHNAQPARFRARGQNTVEIIGDPSRILRVADPTLRDHFVSLGAALEGLRMALADEKFACDTTIIARSHEDIDLNAPYHIVASVRVYRDATINPHPLSRFVESRHAFRGIFAPAEPRQVQAVLDDLRSLNLVRVVQGGNAITTAANLYDQANVKFMKEPEFCKELYGWLRFDKNHPQYYIDGLNSDCMALSKVETLAGPIFMHPAILPKILRTPIGAPLISERPKIVSSSFLVALFADDDEHPLTTGVRFYQLWLTIAKHAFSACPLSSIVDDTATAEMFRKLLPASETPQGRRLINVWRCGVTPSGQETQSPRLTAKDLILES